MAQNLSERPQLRRSTAPLCDSNINCCDSFESSCFATSHESSLVARPPIIRRVQAFDNLYFMAWQNGAGEECKLSVSYVGCYAISVELLRKIDALSAAF